MLLTIRRQDTHLDSLAELLQKPRVRAIIEPILVGQELGDVPVDDIQFVLDLGLCRMSPNFSLHGFVSEGSNPAEDIPTE